MARVIKQGVVSTDNWTPLVLAEGDTPDSITLPEGDILYPLAVWQARQADIRAAGRPFGLLLQGADDPATVAADLGQFALVAVNFPKFVDGRGYSIASLLRQRLGYGGELRAVGDVLHDQLFFLRRVGFDAFALREDKDVDHALSQGFTPFSEAYQAATDQPQPYFRRRA